MPDPSRWTQGNPPCPPPMNSSGAEPHGRVQAVGHGLCWVLGTPRRSGQEPSLKKQSQAGKNWSDAELGWAPAPGGRPNGILKDF